MPVIVLLGLATAAMIIVSWWRIYTRIGWSPYLALLMPIPIGGAVIVLYVAFSRWPIEQRMEALETDLKRLRGEL